MPAWQSLTSIRLFICRGMSRTLRKIPRSCLQGIQRMWHQYARARLCPKKNSGVKDGNQIHYIGTAERVYIHIFRSTFRKQGILCSPLSIHHLTKNHRHHRTHRRRRNRRSHNCRRIHAPILALVRLCQAKTKKFLIFLQSVSQ